MLPAGADWTSRARVDTATYVDSDNVTVVTPTVSGVVENAARGTRMIAVERSRSTRSCARLDGAIDADACKRATPPQ